MGNMLVMNTIYVSFGYVWTPKRLEQPKHELQTLSGDLIRARHTYL